jgi:hypothetical protein
VVLKSSKDSRKDNWHRHPSLREFQSTFLNLHDHAEIRSLQALFVMGLDGMYPALKQFNPSGLTTSKTDSPQTAKCRASSHRDAPHDLLEIPVPSNHDSRKAVADSRYDGVWRSGWQHVSDELKLMAALSEKSRHRIGDVLIHQ